MDTRRKPSTASLDCHRPTAIVSACLAGYQCTWRGTNHLNHAVRSRVRNGRAIAVCPEVLGGCSSPRPCAEISGGDGAQVLARHARVITSEGADVSAQFIAGARQALTIALAAGIRTAILKSKSPSCGRGTIYDGTFSGRLRRGDGVFAALLRRNGIRIYTEKSLRTRTAAHSA